MYRPHSRRVLLPGVPLGLSSQALSALVNHLLRGQALREQLDIIEGKVFCLKATDLPLQFTLRIQGRRLQAATGRVADVTIRATARDFVALARRTEDPDTLFFQRRLSLEGATEAGLCLKNLLDGFEFDFMAHCRDVLPAPVSWFMSALRSFPAGRVDSRRSTHLVETHRE